MAYGAEELITSNKFWALHVAMSGACLACESPDCEDLASYYISGDWVVPVNTCGDHLRRTIVKMMIERNISHIIPETALAGG